MSTGPGELCWLKWQLSPGPIHVGRGPDVFGAGRQLLLQLLELSQPCAHQGTKLPESSVPSGASLSSRRHASGCSRVKTGSGQPPCWAEFLQQEARGQLPYKWDRCQ